MSKQDGRDEPLANAAYGEHPLIDISVSENQLTATDLAGHVLDIDARGWVETDRSDAPDLSLRADEIIAGQATELRFEPGTFSFTILDGPSADEVLAQFDEGEIRHIGPQFHLMPGTTAELPEGSYRIRASSTITGLLRIDNAFSIDWETDTQRAVLSFPFPTTVTMGFRSGIKLPRGTITVPPTPEGVATAFSYLSTGLRTMDPERSFPTMRTHPPAIEFGEEIHVPDDVRERVHETGIELVVPPTFDALLPTAPLAYFLGADVRTSEETPVLRIPDTDYEYPLAEPPNLQYQAASLLRRVFYLDSLVRNVGAWGSEIRELDELEASAVDLDVAACYEQSSTARLVTYLDLDYEAIADIFPAWRHWTYVDPDDPEEVVPALPTMMTDMSAVFTPDARDAPERLAATGAAKLPDWKSIVGNLGANAGTGDHEFPASLTGYRNRLAHVTQTDERTSVTVVTTPEMETASEWLEAHYRQQLDTRGTVDRRVIQTTDQLAGIFAESADLLHFVGHCTVDGLDCPDGTLAPEDLTANNARVFILDQPGEADLSGAKAVGTRLVEAGSVSGLLITDGTNPDTSPPTSLPTEAGARELTASSPFVTSGLLLKGASTQMARQTVRYLDETDAVAVVGDGAYRMHSQGMPVFLPELTPMQGGEFRATLHQLLASPGSAVGSVGGQPHLAGADAATTVDARSIRKNMLGEDTILFDGELYWPAETKRLFYPFA